MTGRRSHGRLSALNGVVHQGTPALPNGLRRWHGVTSWSPGRYVHGRIELGQSQAAFAAMAERMRGSFATLDR